MTMCCWSPVDLGILSGSVAQKCITCKSDTLEECMEGERAAEFDDQKLDCSDSLPYCEVRSAAVCRLS